MVYYCFQLHISDQDADKLYKQLEDLYQGFKHKYKVTEATRNGKHTNVWPLDPIYIMNNENILWYVLKESLPKYSVLVFCWLIWILS